MPDSLAFIVALIATLVAIPPLSRAAPRLGLVDEPAGRRVHEGSIPLVGGIAMGTVFLAVHLATGLLQGISMPLMYMADECDVDPVCCKTLLDSRFGARHAMNRGNPRSYSQNDRLISLPA